MNVGQKILRSLVDSVGADRLGLVKAADAERSPIFPIFEGEGGVGGNPLLNGGTDEARQRQAEQLAKYSVWIQSDINLIGNALSSVELRVLNESDTGNTPINNHPYEKIMRRPNPYMSSSFLKKYTSNWYQLRGEAYWMLVPNSLGELAEIWPLPANRMTPVADGKDYIRGYLYRSEGGASEPTPLLPENICYFREPNPGDYHRGLSKLIAIASPATADARMAGWNTETFTNEATLRTMFNLSPTIQPKIFDQIKKEIVSELVHGNKRYMVSRAGEVNVSQLGMSQKEMEFIAGREFNRNEIDRAFLIPEGIWNANATEASAKVAQDIFLTFAVWPFLVMVQEDITSQILTRWYDDDLVAQFDDIRPSNIELHMKESDQRWESMSVNQVRIETGQEPRDDAYGDVPWPLRSKKEALLLVEPMQPHSAVSIAVGRETSEEIIEANTEPETDLALKAAIKSDWKNWKSIAIRESRGANVSTYDFKSDVISLEDIGIVKTALSFTVGNEAVRHLFSDIRHTIEHVKALTTDEFPPELQDAIEDVQSELDTLTTQAANGEISQSDFESRMRALIEAAILASFLSGGGEDGTLELDTALDIADDAVSAYATDLYSGRYDDNADSLRTRNLLWLIAIASVYNIGVIYGGDEQEHLIWQRGGTVDPCVDCVALDNTVMTREQWKGTIWRPQGRMLVCGGWYCLCTLSATSSPVGGAIPTDPQDR